MFYIGIDQHKSFSQVAVLDSSGQVVKQKKLYHDSPELFRKFFTPYSDGIAVLEANRNWDWLYDLIESEVKEVKMSHPLRTRLIAEAKVKTDKVDARVLANLVRLDYLPEAYTPPRSIRESRGLFRFRVHIVRTRTRLKNRIHALLDRQGIRHSFSDLFGKKGRQFLDQLSMRPCYDFELTSSLFLLDAISGELQKAQKEIRKAMKTDPCGQLLMTVPGIGELLAYLIVYEVGEIERFSSAERFASYCGLTPSVHQSAAKRYHGHIGKGGNHYLKWAFVEAAHVAKKRDPGLKATYARIARKSGKNKANVAVARKLAVSVFYMLTRDMPYRYKKPSGQYLGKPE